MIMTRAPLRISFFGGGTDYPQYFNEHGGEVLATAIDKYVYFTVSHLGDLFEHKIRVAYSKTELVHHADEIQHRAIREALRYLGLTSHVELNNIADLPARTGLGSSSAFMVCLLQALRAHIGKPVSALELAYEAIEIEQNRLADNVGCQDQFLAATGGFQHVEFAGSRNIRSTPVEITSTRQAELEKNLLLVYTGQRRTASEIAAEQVSRTTLNLGHLHEMKLLVREALGILRGGSDLADFGRLLGETWKLKRSLSSKISNNHIDEMYEAALRAGCVGGKLLGAGGGGFLLLYVDHLKQERVLQALSGYQFVRFAFEAQGSKIVYQKAGGINAT